MRSEAVPAVRGSLVTLVGLISILATACQGTAATPVASSSALARFQRCAVQPRIGAASWLCGTLNVPLDRGNPAGATIPLAIYVLPHTDHSSAAAEPLFTTPGGPGYAHFENYGLWPMQQQLLPHHDIVTIDERGTGLSGGINCPDLQRGPIGFDQLEAAVSACASQLGAASDRYGAGDVALDVEAVRNLLRYSRIDYYGGSYGSIDAQAYAARFPKSLRAMVLDSGFTVAAGGPDFANFFGIGTPAALIDIAALECRRDVSCKALEPDPASTIGALIRRVRAKPIKGQGSANLVDEAAVASLVAGADPIEIIRAAVALRSGDPSPLVNLVNTPPSDNGLFTDFSAGMNMAGNCNDSDSPWDRADAPSLRRQKLDAAIAALPADAFAPFSKTAWTAAIPFGVCLAWPAPHGFEPVIPSGATLPDVPVLILSGDADRVVPTFESRPLLGEFPKAEFVIVAGAGHQTLAGPGTCSATIAAQFLETLKLGDTSCAATPG
jgi:pimeloyl-ACP methyl ester carboxylesterase